MEHSSVPSYLLSLEELVPEVDTLESGKMHTNSHGLNLVEEVEQVDTVLQFNPMNL